MKRLLQAFLVFEFAFSSVSYCTKIDSSILIFPQTRLFPSVFLDPLECQVSGGSNFLFRKGNDASLYSMVNFGFTKPVIAKHGESFSWELDFAAATFTQFDLLHRSDASFLAGLMNNDYKLSVDFSLKKNKNVYRLRVFHVSSHLGDDYMLRHYDTIPNDKSDNYEQADFTYLRLKDNNYWYFGAGEIYTPYAFRKRFSLQGGGLLNSGKSEKLNFFVSANIKLLAENNFKPDLRAALGLNFNRKTEPLLRIWLEYYSGQLPYSTIHYGRVNWLGLGMLLTLF